MYSEEQLALVDRAMKMVDVLARKYHRYDDDDFKQECAIGILSAIKYWDSEKGLNWESYAYQRMNQRALNYLRDMRRDKRQKDRENASLDYEYNGEEGEEGTLLDKINSKVIDIELYVINKLTIEDIMRLNLTEKHLTAMRYMYNGLTKKEIADTMHVSRQAVDQWFKKIRKQINEAASEASGRGPLVGGNPRIELTN